MPPEMQVGPLSSLQLDGRLSVFVQGRPTAKVEIKSTCKAKCEPFKALRGSFEYTAYDHRGEPFKRTTGPGTKEWVPIAAVSAAIPQAVITMEDPGFLGHHGFIAQAFENSLRDDLQADRFVRGGSTLTMQLVKNLWLTRNKAVARKAQEVLLATALESCLTKDQIMELYLNVVEFGPDIYGIGSASRRYFDKHPMALEPVEAFYLASVLPAPRKASLPTPAILARTSKLMRRLAANGHRVDGIGPDDIVDDTPVDLTGWEEP